MSLFNGNRNKKLGLMVAVAVLLYAIFNHSIHSVAVNRPRAKNPLEEALNNGLVSLDRFRERTGKALGSVCEMSPEDYVESCTSGLNGVRYFLGLQE